MKRVTRPGGTLVVADEIPHLHRYGIGHLIGFPSLDASGSGPSGSIAEFADGPRITISTPTPSSSARPGRARSGLPIWGGLGYCFVHADTASGTDSDSPDLTPNPEGSPMMATEQPPTADWTSDLDLWRCLSCAGSPRPAAAAMVCDSCGRTYPVRDGVLVAKAEVSDNNKVAVDFYNSPLWPKFRFWEWFTFICNGGEKRSRDKVLRHLPKQADLKLLDVAIGDGVYLDWLPADWSVVGIDVSTVQLEACRRGPGLATSS